MAIVNFNFGLRVLLVAVSVAPSTNAQHDSVRPWVANRAEWRAKTMSDRHAERRQIQETEFAATERAVTKPWRAKRSKHFLIVSNADRKFTQRAIKAADEFFEWCHEHFDAASDEYVRHRVLRIIDGEPEDSSSVGASTRRGLTLDVDRPLATHRDEDHGNTGLQFAELFRDVLDVYVMDKDILLYRYAPPWFAQGVSNVAGTVYLKSGKIQFRPSDAERDDVRLLIRNGEAATLRELLSATGDEARAIEFGDGGRRHQMTKAVRFFLFGPGRKHKLTKSFWADYMRAVIAAAEAKSTDWDPKALDAIGEGLDEDAAKEAAAARDKEFRARQAAVTLAAFETVCGGWSDKDWRTIERVFEKYEPR